MKKIPNGMTLEQSTDRVKTLITTMKSVTGFKVGEPIKGMVEAMAGHIELGQQDDAIAKAGEIFSVGRSILGKFLRNSVVSQMAEVAEGQDPTVAKEAFFVREIRLRREDGFDADLLARLEKFRKELEEAVRVETNGTFDQRIMAYNSMSKVLVEADAEQRKRDRVRMVREEETKRLAKKNRDDRATELNIAAAQTQRQRLLSKRKEEADSIRGLL